MLVDIMLPALSDVPLYLFIAPALFLPALALFIVGWRKDKFWTGGTGLMASVACLLVSVYAGGGYGASEIVNLTISEVEDTYNVEIVPPYNYGTVYDGGRVSMLVPGLDGLQDGRLVKVESGDRPQVKLEIVSGSEYVPAEDVTLS